MKIIFCCRKESIEVLKEKPTAHKTSKIRTKFSETKFLRNREFRSIANIEYLEFLEKPVFATIYDSLMNRQLFEHNFQNLDHRAIFEKYVEFNKEIAEKINGILEKDDLVIINDSSLLLVPSLVKARVAIRNLKFEGCFIEKTPYYKEIVGSIIKAQKFFESVESYESFNSYMACSFDFREKGGCWHLKSYVDKFLILDTLERMKKSIQNIENKMENTDEMSVYLQSFAFPKKEIVVLTDATLLHLEPFIKENPNVHIRYLRTGIEFNEEFARMMQYLKKMYHNKISVADSTEYSHVIAEMFYCDVFAGQKYSELAKFFGKPVISDKFDSFELKDDLFAAVQSKKSARYDVIGEEEYLMEFLQVNGYDLVIETDMSQETEVEKMIGELNSLIRKNAINQFWYEKTLSDGNKEYYSKKEDIIEEPKTISYYPVLQGVNGYLELKNKKRQCELNPMNTDKVIEMWKESNKILLLDYDGTLTPIVTDPAKACPPENIIDILLELNKKGKVVICSGRQKEPMDLWIPKEIEVYAEHGAFSRINGEWKSCFTVDEERKSSISIMEYYAKRTPGVRLEMKETGAVFHYREADENFDVKRLYTLLRRVGGEKITRVIEGIEYKSGTKRRVCDLIDPALCAGDDTVDEDMYLGCNGISIHVGKGESFADGYVEDVTAFRNLLETLSKI